MDSLLARILAWSLRENFPETDTLFAFPEVSIGIARSMNQAIRSQSLGVSVLGL